MTSCTMISTTCMLSFVIISAIFLIDFASASAFDCVPGYGCNYYPYKEADDHNINYNRKMLMDLVGPSKLSRGVYVDEGKVNDEVEMRNVPNGPDPLHHNGGPQKKPRISP